MEDPKKENLSKIHLDAKVDFKGMYYVELHNPSAAVRRKVLTAMGNRVLTSDVNKLKTDAGAFLQSDDDDYMLLEFWKPSYQGFIDYLNKVLNE